MPFASADRSRHPVVTPSTAARDRLRPGWTEIAVGLLVCAVLAVGSVQVITPDGVGPVAFGVFMMALSAIAAGGGFAAAALVRIRSLSAFGIRRTTGRWLWIGLVGGIVAFALKFPAIAAYGALSGDTANPQADWSTVATTGVGTTIVAILFLGILTPIGEELLFRGVVTTALLRYGAIVGVVGSAVIFAGLHLAPATVLAALAVGLIAGELRRRSGSVLPGITVHIVFNVLSNVLAFVLLPALSG